MRYLLQIIAFTQVVVNLSFGRFILPQGDSGKIGLVSKYTKHKVNEATNPGRMRQPYQTGMYIHQYPALYSPLHKTRHFLHRHYPVLTSRKHAPYSLNVLINTKSIRKTHSKEHSKPDKVHSKKQLPQTTIPTKIESATITNNNPNTYEVYEQVDDLTTLSLLNQNNEKIKDNTVSTIKEIVAQFANQHLIDDKLKTKNYSYLTHNGIPEKNKENTVNQPNSDFYFVANAPTKNQNSHIENQLSTVLINSDQSKKSTEGPWKVNLFGNVETNNELLVTSDNHDTLPSDYDEYEDDNEQALNVLPSILEEGIGEEEHGLDHQEYEDLLTSDYDYLEDLSELSNNKEMSLQQYKTYKLLNLENNNNSPAPNISETITTQVKIFHDQDNNQQQREQSGDSFPIILPLKQLEAFADDETSLTLNTTSKIKETTVFAEKLEIDKPTTNGTFSLISHQPFDRPEYIGMPNDKKLNNNSVVDAMDIEKGIELSKLELGESTSLIRNLKENEAVTVEPQNKNTPKFEAESEFTSGYSDVNTEEVLQYIINHSTVDNEKITNVNDTYQTQLQSILPLSEDFRELNTFFTQEQWIEIMQDIIKELREGSMSELDESLLVALYGPSWKKLVELSEMDDIVEVADMVKFLTKHNQDFGDVVLPQISDTNTPELLRNRTRVARSTEKPLTSDEYYDVISDYVDRVETLHYGYDEDESVKEQPALTELLRVAQAHSDKVYQKIPSSNSSN